MFIQKLIRSATALALIATPATVTFTSEGWSQVGTIVVTTRKREENLQDVPLSVSTFGAIQIQQRGIQGISDVAKLTPGVEFTESFGAQDTRITIRGLSQTRGRPNAAFLVDGVDLTGEGVSTAGGGFSVNRRLLDVERIEVVKGPQTALYGRSAFAGAIQYITRSPSMEEFEVEAVFDISVKEDYEASGSVGGPIIQDILALRVNGLYWNEDGYHDSSLTGETVGGGDGWGLAGTVLFEPTESISAKVRVAYSEDNYEVSAQARIPSNTLVDLPASLVTTRGGFPFVLFAPNYPDCAGKVETAVGTITDCFQTPKVLVAGNLGDADGLAITQSPNPATGGEFPGTNLETFQLTSKIDWDIGFGTVTSYTGYLSSTSDQLFDGDWDSLPAGTFTSLDGSWSDVLPPCGFADCSPVAGTVDFQNDTGVISQELRFASDFDGPFQFAVGGNFWRENVDQIENGVSVSGNLFRGSSTVAADLTPAALIIPVALVGPREAGRETTHWSGYGMLEWDIGEKFKVSFEGRYVDETVDVLGIICDGPGTQARTGFPSTDAGVDLNGDGKVETTGPESVPDGIPETCHGNFRGGSSLVNVGVQPGGPPIPFVPATLPTGSFANAAFLPLLATSSESFFTPKGTVEWTPTENQLYYFSVARAVKPGGISTIRAGAFFDVVNSTFTSEKLMAYELGAKTSWLDNTLIINGAAYFQKFSDKQVGTTQFDPRIGSDTGRIENAGEAEILGIEIDSLWQVTEEITLGAAYSFIDAEYTSFKSSTGSANELARIIASGNAGCLNVIDSNPGPGIANICEVDRTGNRIEGIAKHSFVGTAEYRAPAEILGNWFCCEVDWFLQSSVVYTGERPAEENNFRFLDSYVTADFRLGISTENVDFLVYVDNAFNNDTIKGGIDFGSTVNTFRQTQFPPAPTDGFVANLPDPRVVGFRGRVRY